MGNDLSNIPGRNIEQNMQKTQTHIKTSDLSNISPRFTKYSPAARVQSHPSLNKIRALGESVNNNSD